MNEQHSVSEYSKVREETLMLMMTDDSEQYYLSQASSFSLPAASEALYQHHQQQHPQQQPHPHPHHHHHPMSIIALDSGIEVNTSSSSCSEDAFSSPSPASSTSSSKSGSNGMLHRGNFELPPLPLLPGAPSAPSAAAIAAAAAKGVEGMKEFSFSQMFQQEQHEQQEQQQDGLEQPVHLLVAQTIQNFPCQYSTSFANNENLIMSKKSTPNEYLSIKKIKAAADSSERLKEASPVPIEGYLMSANAHVHAEAEAEAKDAMPHFSSFPASLVGIDNEAALEIKKNGNSLQTLGHSGLEENESPVRNDIDRKVQISAQKRRSNSVADSMKSQQLQHDNLSKIEEHIACEQMQTAGSGEGMRSRRKIPSNRKNVATAAAKSSLSTSSTFTSLDQRNCQSSIPATKSSLTSANDILLVQETNIKKANSFPAASYSITDSNTTHSNSIGKIVVGGVPEVGAKTRVETQTKIALSFFSADGDRLNQYKWLRLPEMLIGREKSAKLRTKLKADRNTGIRDREDEMTLFLEPKLVSVSNPTRMIHACPVCVVREVKRLSRRKDKATALASVLTSSSASSAHQQQRALGEGNESLTSLSQQNKALSALSADVADLLDENTELDASLLEKRILIFNSGSKVSIVDAECTLLTRITCYCRHHGERVGFAIQLAAFDYHGKLVAKGISPPIMITDDHKAALREIIRSQLSVKPVDRNENSLEEDILMNNDNIGDMDADTSNSSSIVSAGRRKKLKDESYVKSTLTSNGTLLGESGVKGEDKKSLVSEPLPLSYNKTGEGDSEKKKPKTNSGTLTKAKLATLKREKGASIQVSKDNLQRPGTNGDGGLNVDGDGVGEVETLSYHDMLSGERNDETSRPLDSNCIADESDSLSDEFTALQSAWGRNNSYSLNTNSNDSATSNPDNHATTSFNHRNENSVFAAAAMAAVHSLMRSPISPVSLSSTAISTPLVSPRASATSPFLGTISNPNQSQLQHHNSSHNSVIHSGVTSPLLGALQHISLQLDDANQDLFMRQMENLQNLERQISQQKDHAPQPLQQQHDSRQDHLQLVQANVALISQQALLSSSFASAFVPDELHYSEFASFAENPHQQQQRQEQLQQQQQQQQHQRQESMPFSLSTMPWVMNTHMQMQELELQRKLREGRNSATLSSSSSSSSPPTLPLITASTMTSLSDAIIHESDSFTQSSSQASSQHEQQETPVLHNHIDGAITDSYVRTQESAQSHMSTNEISQVTLSKIVPNEGPLLGGVECTILGNNFDPSQVVLFGEHEALMTQHWGSNTIVCLVPPALLPGPVPVTITNCFLPPSEPLIFTYKDDTDHSLMELALQVIGVKMSGQLTAASRVALDVMLQGKQSGQSKNNSVNSSSGGGRSNDDTNGSIEQSGLSRSDQSQQLLSLLASHPAFTLLASRGVAYAAGSQLSRLAIQSLEPLIIICLCTAALMQNSNPFNLAIEGRGGKTLLHLAAARGFASLVGLLVKCGMNLNQQDFLGFTPLHFAVMFNNYATVQKLVDAGASVDTETHNGLVAADFANGDPILLSIIYPSSSSLRGQVDFDAISSSLRHDEYEDCGCTDMTSNDSGADADEEVNDDDDDEDYDDDIDDDNDGDEDIDGDGDVVDIHDSIFNQNDLKQQLEPKKSPSLVSSSPTMNVALPILSRSLQSTSTVLMEQPKPVHLTPLAALENASYGSSMSQSLSSAESESPSAEDVDDLNEQCAKSQRDIWFGENSMSFLVAGNSVNPHLAGMVAATGSVSHSNLSSVLPLEKRNAAASVIDVAPSSLASCAAVISPERIETIEANMDSCVMLPMNLYDRLQWPDVMLNNVTAAKTKLHDADAAASQGNDATYTLQSYFNSKKSMQRKRDKLLFNFWIPLFCVMAGLLLWSYITQSSVVISDSDSLPTFA